MTTFSRPVFRTRTLAAFSLGAMLIIAAFPAGAWAAGWSPATQTVLAPPLNASQLDIAVNSVGDSAAAWTTDVGGTLRIEASVRPSGGNTWSVPVRISPVGQTATSPDVAIDESGTAHVVWDTFDGVNQRVQTARSFGMLGTWGPFTTISPAGEDSGNPDIALGSDRTAHVVWENATAQRIQYAGRSPLTGLWSAAQSVSAAGTSNFNARVAVDSQGTVSAVWVRSDARTRIQSSFRPTLSGVWAAPVYLSADGQDASNPVLAVGSNGRAHAAWVRTNGVDTIVFASHRVEGTWFTQQVSTDGLSASAPSLAVDGSGAPHVAFVRESQLGNSILYVASAPNANSYYAILTMIPAGAGDSLAPQLAAGAEGTIALTWLQLSGGNQGVLGASTQSPISGWGAATEVSAPAITSNSHALAVDGSGNASSIWIVANGANDSIKSRVFDSTSPQGQIQAPADAVAGRSVELRATTSDVYSSVDEAGISWTPGDGSAAKTGSVVSHTFAQAGSYTIQLTITDSVGNVSSKQHVITVAPAEPERVHPRVTVRPKITGTVKVRERISCNQGSWIGSPPPTFSFTWQRRTSRGWSNIRGANRVRYRLTRADAGKRVRCMVEAKNSAGTARASTPARRVAR